MSSTKTKCMGKIAVVVLLFLTAVSHPLRAQSVPGVYGGGPLNELGTYRYIQLQGASGDVYTYPLNGILNYVAYYSPDGAAFIPGGGYSVYYLNSAKSVVGSAGSVTYSPNSGYTNGVEVSPPNPGASGPLGVQGTISKPEGATVVPTTVRLVSSSGTIVAYATANGNGFFSLYYSAGTNETAGFVPAGSYTVEISGGNTQINGKCYYSYKYSNTAATYSPSNTTNPSLESYFVTNAATNLGTINPTVSYVCH